MLASGLGWHLAFSGGALLVISYSMGSYPYRRVGFCSVYLGN